MYKKQRKNKSVQISREGLIFHWVLVVKATWQTLYLQKYLQKIFTKIFTKIYKNIYKNYYLQKVIIYKILLWSVSNIANFLLNKLW
jgi:ribosomal protein S3AE